MSTKRCPNCGNELSAETKFCVYCGTNVANVPVEVQAAAEPVVETVAAVEQPVVAAGQTVVETAQTVETAVAETAAELTETVTETVETAETAVEETVAETVETVSETVETAAEAVTEVVNEPVVETAPVVFASAGATPVQPVAPVQQPVAQPVQPVAAPVFQSPVAPAATAAAPGFVAPAAAPKAKKKVSVGTIIFAILALAAIGVLGFMLYKNMTEVSNLKSENFYLQARVNQLQEENDSLSEYVDSLSDDMNYYYTYSNIANEILYELDASYVPHGNFYSENFYLSNNYLILNQGDGGYVTLTTTEQTDGTYNYYFDDYVIDVTFTANSWETSVDIWVDAVSTGASMLTIENDDTGATCGVLVIVLPND